MGHEGLEQVVEAEMWLVQRSGFLSGCHHVTIRSNTWVGSVVIQVQVRSSTGNLLGVPAPWWRGRREDVNDEDGDDDDGGLTAGQGQAVCPTQTRRHRRQVHWSVAIVDSNVRGTNL